MIYIKGQIWQDEIASSVEYRMDEEFHNLKIFETELRFFKLGNFESFLIFQFGKLQKLPEFYNIENHQVYIIDKFLK